MCIVIYIYIYIFIYLHVYIIYMYIMYICMYIYTPSLDQHASYITGLPCNAIFCTFASDLALFLPLILSCRVGNADGIVY